MDPGSPEYEARMQADIARLQASKGINMRAWLRENKVLLLVFGAYLGLMAIYTGVAVSMGDPPGSGILLGAFMGPLVMLRMALRFRRRR